MTVPTGEVKRVADLVLSRIVGGVYASGMRLPSELDLATDLSCGRSTVREALRHLAGLGIVQSRRGSGAMVLDFRREGTPPLLPAYVLAGRFDRPLPILARELLHMRSMLACEAVRLAALYAEPVALDEARRILARAAALEGDPAAHVLTELELFRSLVHASGIWPAVWLANVFWAPLRELHATLAPILGGPTPDYQRHTARLLELIEKRDADGAVRHLRRWLDGVDAHLQEGFERALDSASPPVSAARLSSRAKVAARSRKAVAP